MHACSGRYKCRQRPFGIDAATSIQTSIFNAHGNRAGHGIDVSEKHNLCGLTGTGLSLTYTYGIPHLINSGLKTQLRHRLHKIGHSALLLLGHTPNL